MSFRDGGGQSENDSARQYKDEALRTADLPLHGGRIPPWLTEVAPGAPSRFADPARFSFAHGGKFGPPNIKSPDLWAAEPSSTIHPENDLLFAVNSRFFPNDLQHSRP
jgi:hypothetical protein